MSLSRDILAFALEETKWHGKIPVEYMRTEEILRDKKGRILSNITSNRKITKTTLTRTVSL